MFYGSYPSTEATNVPSGVRRGSFEHLNMVIGVGYDQNDARKVKVIVATDPSEGILQWPQPLLKRIRNTNIPGTTSLEQKQLHVFNYFFELAYELMLSPDDDVSSSPGFESCGLKSFA